MFDWLRKLIGKLSPSEPAKNDVERRVQSVTNQLVQQARPASVQPKPVATPPPAESAAAQPSNETHAEEAQTYLKRLHEKVDALAERFARGGINRKQFEELFAHYQGEIQSIEQFMAMNPDLEEWKNSGQRGPIHPYPAKTCRSPGWCGNL